MSESTVKLPWGSFTRLYNGDGFQVKSLKVDVGRRLSLQTHRFRAEHWIVIRGSGTVTCDDDTFVLNQGKSTYIPLGALHRLANDGDSELEIIEVQVGTYFGEDDIVRYDDDFER